MKDGVLEVTGKKVKATIERVSLPIHILEDVKNNDDEGFVEVGDANKVDKPLPNDSPGIEVVSEEFD